MEKYQLVEGYQLVEVKQFYEDKHHDSQVACHCEDKPVADL